MESDIIIERAYPVPLSRLWKALTEREELKRWYFDFPEEFQLIIGAEFDWYAGPPDGKQWLHRGKMLEIVAGKKILHTWEYPGYKGSSRVCWELRELDPDNSLVHFKQIFDVPFDPTEPELVHHNFVEGWTYILNTALVEYLANTNNA